MNEDCLQIAKSPAFKKLIKEKNRFCWFLSAIALFIYFSFILAVAFIPSTLKKPIADGMVMTVGIPVGIAVIAILFMLSGFYVYKSNNDFDKRTEEIIKKQLSC
ncbi:MAG: DUF485 domain-containing protein [Alphaproteobacteria bacterium]|nr:DUF485 domain-containing protein [Alphaproteobacteria bacterium]